MPYEIKRVGYEDLDRIYPSGEDAEISKFTHAKQHWPRDMRHLPWAIDEQSGVFLMALPMMRVDVANRYIFGMLGGVTVIRQERYCLYSILYLSPRLEGHLSEVKDRIREIFRVAGEAIDGTTDENRSFAVPNAQFGEQIGRRL